MKLNKAFFKNDITIKLICVTVALGATIVQIFNKL